MSRKYKILDQEKIYFVSFATINWIDLFIRKEYSQILLESLKYCQVNKGLELFAWCIMPSHMHLIIGTNKNKIQDILRDFKSFTSHKLKEEILNNNQESRKEWIYWMMMRAGKKNSNNDNWQLWQQHNHPITLSTNEMINQRLEYLHNNPVKAGFVNEAEYWRNSSATDYAGGKGLLDIKFLD